MSARDRVYPVIVTYLLDEQGEPKRRVEIHPADDLAISGVDNLDNDLRDQPGLRAWYGLLREHAHEGMKLAKYAEHKRYERLYNAERDRERDVEAKKKSTDNMIRMRIMADPKIREHLEDYMLWRHRYGLLRAICDACEERGRILQTLEASLRRDRALS